MCQTALMHNVYKNLKGTKNSHLMLSCRLFADQYLWSYFNLFTAIRFHFSSWCKSFIWLSPWKDPKLSRRCSSHGYGYLSLIIIRTIIVVDRADNRRRCVASTEFFKPLLCKINDNYCQHKFSPNCIKQFQKQWFIERWKFLHNIMTIILIHAITINSNYRTNI